MTSLVWETKGLRPSVPVPGFEETPPTVQTGPWIDPIERRLGGTIHPSPLWQLRRERRVFKLRRPLMIRAWVEDGFFFVENEPLGICGTGTRLEEAVADFSIHVVHFYEYYKKMSKAKLIGDAIRLKAVFHDLFIEG